MASQESESKDQQVSVNLLMKSSKTCDSLSTSSHTSEEEGDDVRHTWDKKTEYILAAVGYCVGLGNIWRFPYVCMRNGGGAFLIPFLLSLFICALPIYFLETAIGQFNGQSSWHVWSLCPLFKGIGVSMNLLSFFCAWYYSIILAWALIYVGNSFKAPLPWTQCGQSWNTEACIDTEGVTWRSKMSADGNLTSAMANATSGLMSNLSNTVQELMATGNLTTGNASDVGVGVSNNVTVSATEEFWMLFT